MNFNCKWMPFFWGLGSPNQERRLPVMFTRPPQVCHLPSLPAVLPKQSGERTPCTQQLTTNKQAIMSGRGKGGKGLGKGGAKRHRKVLRDNIQGALQALKYSCIVSHLC